jgi:hypothetical protein
MHTPKTVWMLLIIVTLTCFFSGGAFAAPSASELVYAYGDEFYINGISYRFVGMNIRGISHYGQGNPLPYTTTGHITENLDGMVAMGGKVIRLFAAVNNTTKEDAANRLESVLDAMETRGLKAIVSLTDLYNTPFHPQGDDGYYMSQPGGWTLLDDTWFAGGYTVNYLPWVEHVVNQLKDHNAVFCWQLGNELTDIKNPNNIIAFTANVAAAIKAIDPYHMVSTGFLSLDHTQIGETNGYNLYADSNIDFITVHSYNGAEHHVNHAVHSRLRKPLLLEEYGWDAAAGDRVTNTTAQLTNWFTNHQVRGFMNWGYQAQSYDIGDGDNIYGIDQYAHPDYTAMVGLYTTKAAELAAGTFPQPDRLEPDGVNVALSSTGWLADSTFSSAYGGDKVYDGVISGASKWTSDGSAPPHWLSIDLGQERSVNGITLRMAGAAAEDYRYAFKVYEIQSGTSLSGPWATEFSVSNPAQFSFLHSLYDTPKTLRYLRIYITDSGIDNYCRLPEFEVYEEVTGVGEWWVYY